jgi:hypothetical protein
MKANAQFAPRSGMLARRLWFSSIVLLDCVAVGTALPQERFYEWHWEMHPMWWWGWGIGMMAMMLLLWALIIVGLIVGIR